MASQEVTGATREELEEKRKSWKGGELNQPFDRAHCLCPINKQPDDYDGPQRYCTLNRNVLRTMTGKTRCDYHRGPASAHRNLDKLANMKHGMHATREHLVEDFDEKDQALYDWIIETWPDAYDINFEEDPQAQYDFHRLAAEIVRAERGRGYLIEEGEVKEQKVYGDDGVVIDENGEVVTEKSEHYLAQMLHRQDNKISDIEKELGITRKERLRQDSQDDAVEAFKTFAELGGAFLDKESKDYDPEDEPWAEDDNEPDS